MDTITHHHLETDLCVVGGGLAGLCAAIACARNGGRVVLIQDRPVLGGNASSEIRVPIGGAYGIPRPDGSVQEFREGGIIEELQLFNLRHNPTLRWTLWDHVLYQFAKAEPRLTLLLNTTVQSLEMEGDRIASVTGWHLTQYCHYTVRARLFADCSGDSILRMSGARCTRGREGQEEYGESFAPVQGDSMAMGSSLMISALPNQKTYRPFLPPGKPIPFTEQTIPDQLRCNLEKAPYLFTASIETGGTRDGDEIRDELYSLAYGFWDFTKNQPGHGAELWNLEWLGSLPGRRESFRYLGDYVLTQNDIQAGGPFHDAVCHGGWPMDDHFPEGYRYPHGQTVMHPAPTPYGIPYRCLYSQNVENLFFAGRNVSVTHMALSSTRVMGTCAVMGQAVGTAAALAIRHGTSPRGVYESWLEQLQDLLQEQDQFIPFRPRKSSPLTRSADYSHEALRDGIDRSLMDGDHGAWFSPGECCQCAFPAPASLTGVRIVVDTDCTDNTRLRRGWETSPVPRELPPMMPRDFDIQLLREGQWHTAAEIRDNWRRYLSVRLEGPPASALRILWKRGWGEGAMHVFGLDVR